MLTQSPNQSPAFPTITLPFSLNCTQAYPEEEKPRGNSNYQLEQQRSRSLGERARGYPYPRPEKGEEEDVSGDGGGNYGLAWALLPLSLGMVLFAYWLLVVRVYLARVREATEAAYGRTAAPRGAASTTGNGGKLENGLEDEDIEAEQKKKLLDEEGEEEAGKGGESNINSVEYVFECTVCLF